MSHPSDHPDFVHFGDLIRKLRVARGYTQSKLAGAAGLAESTLRKIESTEDCRMMSATAIAVAEELQRAAPFTADEAAAYARHTGISEARLSRQFSSGSTPAANLVRDTAARAFRGEPLPPREPAPSSPGHQLGESLRRLVAATSTDYVRGLLDAAYIAATMQSAPKPTPAPISHLTPGVNQHPPPPPGAVAVQHQTHGAFITEYAPTASAAAPPARAAIPKAKKLNG